MSGAEEPSRDELDLIGALGRMKRLIAQGMSPLEAAQKVDAPESAEDYIARNEAAFDALEKRILFRMALT